MPRRPFFLLCLLAACSLPPATGDEPRLSSHIDAVLGPRQNDGYAGVILGSTGARLWSQGVEPKPGLQGKFQYLHNPSLPGSLFEVAIFEDGRPVVFPPLFHQWWPSHIGMEGRADGLRLLERKFITADDRGIDLVQITNESDRARKLTVRLRSPLGLAGRDRLFDTDVTWALAGDGFKPTTESRTVHAAYNPDRTSDVQARASFTYTGDTMWAPLDGETGPERRWTCWSSGEKTDWYEIEFREPREVSRIVLHIFDDRAGVWAPAEIRVQYEANRVLADLATSRNPPAGRNEIAFEPVKTSKIRIVFTHQPNHYSGITELEVYPGVARRIPVLDREIELAPRASVAFPVEMAFGAAPKLGDVDEIFERHLTEYNNWFSEAIPDFECSDAWFTRLWYYRWYVVRHCLADPKAGLLKEPCFFEGRHMPWYPRVITYGHALQTAEARWLRDPRYARGHVRAVFDNQFEGRDGMFDGQFPNVQADRRINHYYTEWIATEPWELFLVHPDLQSLEAQIPKMERNIRGLLDRFDSDKDLLLSVEGHYHTGMEFQPSFFWFNESKSDTSKETPVERVDYTCYLYANVRALEAAGVDREKLSEKIRHAVLEKMWDPERKFFYSLEPKSDKKALVEEIVGFYPHAFRLVPEGDRRYDAVFDRLFDPAQFWGPYPAHSASKRAEFYSQDRPGGCHWNGPTWPFSNVLVAEALANAIRVYRVPQVTRAKYFDFLQRYVRAQYEGGDFTKPLVGEVYHSETGAWKTPTEDYFHSTYADLLIRHVGGLVPRPDATLEFHPIVDAFPFFRFRRVPYRGALLDILWDAPDGRDLFGDGVEGFTVKRDGKVLFTVDGLVHVEWSERGGLKKLE